MTTIKVLSAGSTLHAMRECAALASPVPAGTIEVFTDHGHNIRDAVTRGTADADIVLIPADMAAALEKAGLVRTTVALGTVGIGGVVRAGSNAPKIGSMPEIRTALADADAVLLTRAPTGNHLMTVIAQFGLGDIVAPKLSRFETSTALNIHLTARSDNALGFGPETEIRAGKGVAWIGDVPAEIQIALPYAAAILTNTKAPAIADAFTRFLATDAARDIFRRSGVC
jgi:molybdate transport system substrate-binding protein